MRQTQNGMLVPAVILILLTAHAVTADGLHMVHSSEVEHGATISAMMQGRSEPGRVQFRDSRTYPRQPVL